MADDFEVRRGGEDDAAGIARLMHAVVAERVHSAIDHAWTAEEQRRHLRSLSNREAVHVAVSPAGEIVGCQLLERYWSMLQSMAHVGQVGTFILPAWRGRGAGRALFDPTRRFAVSAGYRKMVITVRGSNQAALAFYRSLGFVECGRLARQVVIDGVEDDEIILETQID